MQPDINQTTEWLVSTPYEHRPPRIGISAGLESRYGAAMKLMNQPEPICPAQAGPKGDTLAYQETDDHVLWQPKTVRLINHERSFAICQDAICSARTYSFDCNLNLSSEPLAPLLTRHDGPVVLPLSRAFDQLRDCPRIVAAEPLLAADSDTVRPSHMPEKYDIPDGSAST